MGGFKLLSFEQSFQSYSSKRAESDASRGDGSVLTHSFSYRVKGPASPLPLPFSRKAIQQIRILAMKKACLSRRERSPALPDFGLSLANPTKAAYPLSFRSAAPQPLQGTSCQSYKKYQLSFHRSVGSPTHINKKF